MTGVTGYTVGGLTAAPGSQARGRCEVDWARLGRLENVFGDDVQEIVTPADGVLAYGLASLAATTGDLLASVARPVSRGAAGRRAAGRPGCCPGAGRPAGGP
jgi:hypothetical protein